MSYPIPIPRQETPLPLNNMIQSAQLSSLGSSVGRVSAWYAEHCRFESHLGQLFLFSWEKELSLGIVALLCFVSMTVYCTPANDFEGNDQT